MKYAELKRRMKDAEKRAAQAEAQASGALRLLLGLAETRRCGHRVVAMESWPCPHPECSGHAPSLRIQDEPEPLYYTAGAMDAPLVLPATRILRREQVFLADRSVIWMWRQA